VKLVIGIVRPEKANDVLEALYRAEVRGVSISRVQGHGGELDRVETYRGTTVKMGLADKVRFEIAVSEPFVQPTIDALREGAQTGEVGDGKILVLPLDRVVRIRTGEADDLAVTPVGS
jgi:nitrogen regulatory protein P-II 1